MNKGINKQSDIIADLQIGPTDQGMVRIFVSSESLELPMDFTPDQAIDIANEIKAAALSLRKQWSFKIY